ncbi:hypothetical protein [Nocardia seriolae]|uniref:hypothetical protein n=1 Tax=Nocardia seriolae TaxID=37332 RepID=UPI001E2F43E4|nr:hypothetical protein [Nocardia seriolae]
MITFSVALQRGNTMSRNAELRIALVCYGGVSLAIYMHGITKELHKLVRASRALDQMLDGESRIVNPFTGVDDEPLDTESVYFELLSRLNAQGRPLSVSIDIIAGTSAGGINGVVLGKAIAQNADQGALKRVWIDDADLRILARSWHIGGAKTRTVLALLHKLATFWTDHAVLNGDTMSRLLYQALADMDGKAPVAWSSTATEPPLETLVSQGMGAVALRHHDRSERLRCGRAVERRRCRATRPRACTGAAIQRDRGPHGGLRAARDPDPGLRGTGDLRVPRSVRTGQSPEVSGPGRFSGGCGCRHRLFPVQLRRGRPGREHRVVRRRWRARQCPVRSGGRRHRPAAGGQ